MSPCGTESSGKAGAAGHGYTAKPSHHSFATNVTTAFPISDTCFWNMLWTAVLYLRLSRTADTTKRDVKPYIVAFPRSCLTWRKFHPLESAPGRWMGVE
jgi:hypothetical protein